MSLQGAWRFEEGTGTTSADMSGNSLTATQVPGWTASGHTGGGITLNGTTQGAAVAISNTFDFWSSSTFMCWVRFNSFSGGNRYIMYGPRYGGSGEQGVYVTSTGQLQAVGQGTITGPTLSTNTWYHIAFAFDWASGGGSSNAKLYVDGALVASGTGFPINSGTLRWGGPTGFVINGTIDDARWDSEQLSQAQIQAYMNTPVPGPLESSGTTRFLKASDGSWKPTHTRRIVGSTSGTLYGWQLTKYNTGLNKHGINGDRLPVYTGPPKPLAGATIRDKKITSGLDLSNGGITLERCLVQPTSFGGAFVLDPLDGNGNLAPTANTIRDCTVDGSLLSQFNAAMACGIRVLGTVSGNFVSGFGSGIAFLGAGDDIDGLVENNYVTGLIAWGDPATDGNHSDGFTIRDFTAAVRPARQALIQNNRINTYSGNDTGSCFLQTYAGRIDNVTIQGNLFEGGGYNMGLNMLNAPYSNIKAINNRMTPLGYGASYVQGGVGYTEWTDNYFNAPGQANNAGAVVNPN